MPIQKYYWVQLLEEIGFIAQCAALRFSVRLPYTSYPMDRPSISTKTGDKGTTGLFGGKRVAKHDDRLHAYGTIDELNAILGLILAESDLSEMVRSELSELQRMLFVAGADLATPFENNAAKVPRISPKEIQELEAWGVTHEKDLPPLQKFILPSGSRTGALLHHARTVCRRAERWTVALAEREQVNNDLLIFVNRLSDYFFLAARTANKEASIPETEWESH